MKNENRAADTIAENSFQKSPHYLAATRPRFFRPRSIWRNGIERFTRETAQTVKPGTDVDAG